MNTEAEVIDRAIAALPKRRIFKKGDREFEVRSLIRVSDWRPISEPWWKKKEACVIGEDSCGNFYLRVCDGTVRFWDHETEEEEVLSASVRQFVSALIAPTPVALRPEQVKSAWITFNVGQEKMKKGLISRSSIDEYLRFAGNSDAAQRLEIDTDDWEKIDALLMQLHNIDAGQASEAFHQELLVALKKSGISLEELKGLKVAVRQAEAKPWWKFWK